MAKKRNGFTLIELMIVVSILAILAAIAIPKFTQMAERSREGATVGNVGSLKSAISIYMADNQGAAPADLTDWFSDGAKAIRINGVSYIETMPRVMVRGKNDNSVAAGAASPGRFQADPSANDTLTILEDAPNNGANLLSWGSGGNPGGTGWVYESRAGLVYVNSSTFDSSKRKVPYSCYGY